ncbi:MAG: D-tyrosyl-tRNA(Tyr) deacylase [Spirochaetae bacterium HGW-Spirochaetae-2]|jgi:D-tyrosyl-tRNA(Tyr) deacylase|nr:MAG: D-tyrosyl-tRNA(Tyr) deacylase [Spirochaetae bacterium HGW-Spirochaetae-2]
MRAVIQRVTEASVTVDGSLVGSIDRGLLVYLGVQKGDTEVDLAYLAKKIPRMRLFTDDDGKMNLSVSDLGYSMLVVSQFTLCADLRKGNRPSFDPAAEPAVARQMYELFVEKVRSQGLEVATGEFGASMRVAYTNEGPITLVLDSLGNLKQ